MLWQEHNMVLFIILPCDHAAGFCGYFCCGYTCALWLTGSKTFKCDIKNHGVLKLWPRMGQCSLYGVKNKASVLYLNENLPIPVKSGLCYIFLFAVCFFNYLKLVVGGIAGTKKQNYAYSFAMKTYLQDLLQIMDLNTVYCMTNTF